MNQPKIAGIQQMGIGVKDVQAAFRWYNAVFGMDVPVFEEAAEANLMLPYTGGKPHSRHAILAMNLNGGGGFEIWQYTSRTPVPPAEEIKLGDLGILACRMKSSDPVKLYEELSKHSGIKEHLGPITKDPKGECTFQVHDPFHNPFQVVKSTTWFQQPKNLKGGVFGATIGVSNMESSIEFYSAVLGFDSIVYDETGTFSDLQGLYKENPEVRRVLLRHSKPRSGSFTNLLGTSEIELIQRTDGAGVKIFRDRFWGDLGFIHLCFDIVGMDAMREKCLSLGHPFTVDSSNSFDMGEAAGHFTYIEDPDGALIEFVETHKVPIMKGIGWYIKLKEGGGSKEVPNWLIKAMGIKRKKMSI